MSRLFGKQLIERWSSRALAATLMCVLLTAALGAGIPSSELPADFPKGTPVTVAPGNIGAMLDQISSQSKVMFHFHPQGAGAGVDLVGPPMTLALKEVPLWEAIRQLQDAVGAQGTVEWRAGLAPMGAAVGEPFSNAGAFVIRATSLVHNADFGREDPEIFYVNVLVMSDPSARILAVQHASRRNKAVDDAGNALVPESAPPVTWDMVPERGGGGPRPMESVRIMLQQPRTSRASGTTIKTLEGFIPVLMATKIDTLLLTFPTNESRLYGPIDATIKLADGPSPRAGTTTMELSASFARPGGMSDDDWNQTAAAYSGTRVRLLDANGKEIVTQTGGESTMATRRLTSVIYPMPAEGNKPQILVEIPAEYKTVLVPYRLENLPLP